MCDCASVHSVTRGTVLARVRVDLIESRSAASIIAFWFPRKVFRVSDVMTTASSGQRVIVIGVDASDNAKEAFDCTYIVASVKRYWLRKVGRAKELT